MRSFEEIQESMCSNSRLSFGDKPGRMGQRLSRNIDEAAPYFRCYGDGLPILDVGCGDGWGMQCFNKLGFCSTYGVEVVKSRVDTATTNGVKNIHHGEIEDTAGAIDALNLKSIRLNVFCSHVLEHCKDQHNAILNLQSIANIFWILVPIEKNGTKNPAHFSPITSIDIIQQYFKKNEWKALKIEERFNLEPEACLGFVRTNG